MRPEVQAIPKQLPVGDLVAARQALTAKREAWSQLDLLDEFADEAYLHQINKAASVRVAFRKEPATVVRVRSVLKKIGMLESDVVVAVGCNITGFLELNERLPLWAAVAMILEATGRYPVEMLDD